MHSWTSGAIKLIETDTEKALDYLSKRPEELLRRINYLIKRGCPKEKLTETVVSVSDNLSIQTLVTIINNFSYKITEYHEEIACIDNEISIIRKDIRNILRKKQNHSKKSQMPKTYITAVLPHLHKD